MNEFPPSQPIPKNPLQAIELYIARVMHVDQCSFEEAVDSTRALVASFSEETEHTSALLRNTNNLARIFKRTRGPARYDFVEYLKKQYQEFKQAGLVV